MIFSKRNTSAILVPVIICLLWGCSHKTLTVFFDGVPEENDSLRVASREHAKPADSTLARALAANAAASAHSIHPPFSNKKCGLCHDSSRKGKLIEPQPGLCYQCHDRYEGKFEHGPVASGNCTACHNPHASDNPKLLLRKGQDLCLHCHESDQIDIVPAHEKIDGSACTSCHNPHGENKKFFLN